MPKACPICISPSRAAIERDTLQLRSPTAVGRRWKLDRATVRRHRDAHMDRLAVVDLSGDSSTLTRVEDLLGRLEGVLGRSETQGPTAFANVAREVPQSLELLARLRRELDERPQVAILQAPEWLQLREVVFAALAPFPQARAAVAAALQAVPLQGAPLQEPRPGPPARPRIGVQALPAPKDQGSDETGSG